MYQNGYKSEINRKTLAIFKNEIPMKLFNIIILFIFLIDRIKCLKTDIGILISKNEKVNTIS